MSQNAAQLVAVGKPSGVGHWARDKGKEATTKRSVREEIQGSTNRDRRETISSKECVGQAQRPDEKPDQERKQFCRLGRLPKEMVKGWSRPGGWAKSQGPARPGV